jgi:FkbM family methyltransferase
MLKKIILKLLGNGKTKIKLDVLRQKYFPKKHEVEDLNKRVGFYSQFINKGDLVYDVGANVGNRTDAFINLGAKVVAIEPQPLCQFFLKQKFGKKITLEKVALGSQKGKMEMFISDVSTISSFDKEWINTVKMGRFNMYNWDKSIEVDMVLFDEIIDKYGKPAFTKIDVEGFELEVLKGLTNFSGVFSLEFALPEFLDRAVEYINFMVSKTDCVFNLSLLESMDLLLDKWCSHDELINKLKDLAVEETFGDIYIRIITK